MSQCLSLFLLLWQNTSNCVIYKHIPPPPRLWRFERLPECNVSLSVSGALVLASKMVPYTLWLLERTIAVSSEGNRKARGHFFRLFHKVPNSVHESCVLWYKCLPKTPISSYYHMVITLQHTRFGNIQNMATDVFETSVHCRVCIINSINSIDQQYKCDKGRHKEHTNFNEKMWWGLER